MTRLRCTLLALPLLVFFSLTIPWAAAADGPVTVKFRSLPEGALVVVDGQDQCAAPCEMKLLAGTHVVGMSHDGYLAREEMVEVKQGSNSLKWELAPHLGTISISSDPAGVEVQLRAGKGKLQTLKTPVDGLETRPGTYEITLSDARFARQQQSATVRPGEETRVDLETVPTKGTLSITVLDEAGDPDKAAITLNGKSYRGAGPWTLKPGSYRVEVKHRGQLVMDQSVTVEAGSDIALDVQTAPQ